MYYWNTEKLIQFIQNPFSFVGLIGNQHHRISVDLLPTCVWAAQMDRNWNNIKYHNWNVRCANILLQLIDSIENGKLKIIIIIIIIMEIGVNINFEQISKQNNS